MKARTQTKRKIPEDVQFRTPPPKKRLKAARKSATRASDPRPSTSQTRLDSASRVLKEKPRPRSLTQPNAVASSSQTSTSLKRKLSQISSTPKTASSNQFWTRKVYQEEESSDSDSDKTPPPGILQYLSPRSKLAQNKKYPTPKGRKSASPSKPKGVHIGSIEISSDSGEETRRPPTKRIKTRHERESDQDIIDLCSDGGEVNPTPKKSSVRTRIEGDIIDILTTDEESAFPPPPTPNRPLPTVEGDISPTGTSSRHASFLRALTPLDLGCPSSPPACFAGDDLPINIPTHRATRSHVVEPSSGKSSDPSAAVIKDCSPANALSPHPGPPHNDRSSDPVNIYNGSNREGYEHMGIPLGPVDQDTLSSSAPKSPRKVASGLGGEDSGNRFSPFEADADSDPLQLPTSDLLIPHTREGPQEFPDKDDKTSEILPLPQLQYLYNGVLEKPSVNADADDPVSGSPFTSKDLITKVLSIDYAFNTRSPTLITPLFFSRHQTRTKLPSHASKARSKSPSPQPARPERSIHETFDESPALQVEVPLPDVETADESPVNLVMVSPPSVSEISNENTPSVLSNGQTRALSPLALDSEGPILQPRVSLPPLALSEVRFADIAQPQVSPISATISEEWYEDPANESSATPPRILSPSLPIYEEPEDATADELLAAQARSPSLFPPKSEEPNLDLPDKVSAMRTTNILADGLAEVYEEDLIGSQLLVQLLMDTDEMSVCDANDDPAPPIHISSPTPPPECHIPAETDPPCPIPDIVGDSAMVEARESSPSTSPDLQDHSLHSRSPATRRETSQSPTTSEDSAYPVTPARTMEETAPHIQSPSVTPDLSFFEGDLSVQISTYIKNVMEEDDDDDDDDISLSGLEFAYPDVPIS